MRRIRRQCSAQSAAGCAVEGGNIEQRKKIPNELQSQRWGHTQSREVRPGKSQPVSVTILLSQGAVELSQVPQAATHR